MIPTEDRVSYNSNRKNGEIPAMSSLTINELAEEIFRDRYPRTIEVLMPATLYPWPEIMGAKVSFVTAFGEFVLVHAAPGEVDWDDVVIEGKTYTVKLELKDHPRYPVSRNA